MAGLGAGAVRYTIQRFVLILIFAILLFGGAGRWDWVRGWAYLACVFLGEALTLALLAWRSPETLNQRGTAHAQMASFDRLFAALWVLLALATPIVSGCYVRRGAELLPWPFFWAGLIGLIAAIIFGAWSMLENEHFEQFVRIQDDRNHRVVDTGPYWLVRHPGYLAAIFGALVTPMMLGTTSTFVPASLMIALFVWRTAQEDRSLQLTLPGYREFALRTKSRLIPGIW